MPLRFLTAGESHGPRLSAILEGMPAGLPVDRGALARLMARRQAGFGTGGRMAIERDGVAIHGGVQAGHTTGAPLGITIDNLDYGAWAERDIPPMTTPRPGHADLSAALKYGYRDLRLSLERASARETAARVAVGGLCLQLLARFGIEIGSYVTAIGAVRAELSDGQDGSSLADTYRTRFGAAEADELRCPDTKAAAAMRVAIQDAIRAKDTLGGTFEVVALGLPPGLGSHVHWDRRLTGRLLAAVASVPAVKGAEIGPAFDNATLPGTAVHDRFTLGEDPETGEAIVTRRSNRAGGLEGGITTGEPLVVRAAMKPIATTLTPLASVDLAKGEAARTAYERSDFCSVPRAGVIAEAMLAYVLSDALLEKVGGDSITEIAPRLAALRRGRLSELAMDDHPWRFGYDETAG
jgi:chorismate synthase